MNVTNIFLLIFALILVLLVTERYEELRSKIDKTMNPFITIQIPIPEGVDRKAFMELESDREFIEHVREEAIAWIRRRCARSR